MPNPRPGKRAGRATCRTLLASAVMQASPPTTDPIAATSDARTGRLAFAATRRFGPYWLVQTLGAAVDHLALALVGATVVLAADTDRHDPALLELLPWLALVLPFVFLSPLGGAWADRYDKALLIRRLKAVELAVALSAASALLMGSLVGLVLAMFGLGIRAALFGPVKLAILPQQLHREDLLDGTALTVAGTVLAILAGAGLAAGLSQAGPAAPELPALALVSLALAGFAASFAIPRTPPVVGTLAAADRGLPATLLGRVGWLEVGRQPAVRNSVLGISWFWAVGALLLAFAPEAMSGRIAPAVAMGLGAVGVLIGALLAIAASRREVEIGLVPIGSLGLSVAMLVGWYALVWLAPGPGTPAALMALVAVGMAAGLFVVPLYGLLLKRVPVSRLGRTVAANNVANALAMLLAGAIASGLMALGVSPGSVLLGAAIVNVLIAAWIFTLVPEFLLRLIAWLLANVLYRLEVHGRDRIPDTGPVLIVCNHVSYVDAIILMGAIRRPTRFVMYWKIFDKPLAKWLFRAARAIPIAGRSENEAMMEAAFSSVRGELDAGEVVGIFPEGGLTRDGAIAPFRPGVERILAANPVPVVPMALRGLWGSLFSRKHHVPIPRRFRARIALVIGEPIAPALASAALLEQRVRELRGDWA